MEKTAETQQAVERINHTSSEYDNKVNKKEETNTPLYNFEYDEIRELFGSSKYFICCKKEGEEKMLYGIIDKKGKELVPCKMNYIDFMFNGYALLYADNKVGALSSDGKYIAPQFDELENSDIDFLYGRKGDVEGYIDDEGKFIED
jgi:hypothetical protein